MPLLQPNISPASLLTSKNSQNSKKDDKEDTPVDQNSSIKIVANNSLLPTATPISGTGGSDNVDFSEDQTSVYVVKAGDTWTGIAQMYKVSVNTILWANDMSKGAKLVPGDVLFILPVSGLEHDVAKGDTLKSIATHYKVDISDIIQSNDVAIDTELAIGDKLIIPNAEKAEESDKPIPAKSLPASIAKDKQYYESHPTKNISGYYVNPVPGARKSQGIHARNGVDLAAPTGTPIYAAASGIVTLARSGYNGGFGNLVIIKHANGTETLYAHQSKIASSTGERVAQGEVIGYVGSTGKSTGPHLHFEVHGARNPL